MREFQLGTHPHIADTDGDGTNDLSEVQNGSDPTDIVSVPPPASGGTSTQAGGSTDSSGTSNSGSGSGGSPPATAPAPAQTSGLALFTAWRYKEMNYQGG